MISNTHRIAKVAVRRARDDVHAELRRLIVGNAFEAGKKLEEEALAREMGVSRTPVREALIGLEHEGLVRSEPKKGFVVTAPNAELVRESYPILAALETTALMLSGEKLVEALPELRELDRALARATARHDQYELDHGFHRRLIRDCGNARLLKLVETERTRARRFDGAHERGMADREGSAAEHRRIIRAIEKRDFARAASELSAHWYRGIDVVCRWLEAR
jgi:DNA-binding GntR family transcriptional regulator